MKRLIAILFLWNALSILPGIAQQIPQQFNYQAIVRDDSGDPIPGEAVHVDFTIYEDADGFITLYSERHNTNTNTLGLIHLKVGQGRVMFGTFDDINWRQSNYLRVTINGDEGEITAFSSVPYALSADKVVGMSLAELKDVANSIPENGEVLKWNGNKWEAALDETGDSQGDNWGAQFVRTSPEFVGRGINSNPLKLAQQEARNGQVLKWNDAKNNWLPGNDKEGIGSSIWKEGNTSIYYLNNPVGIGVVNPQEKLHVNGNVKIDGDAIISDKLYAKHLYVENSITNKDDPTTGMVLLPNLMTGQIKNKLLFALTKNGDLGRVLLGSTSNARVEINSTALVVDQNRQVGMGLINPQERLHVAGNVRADGDVQTNNILLASKMISSRDNDTYIEYDSNDIKAVVDNQTLFQLKKIGKEGRVIIGSSNAAKVQINHLAIVTDAKQRVGMGTAFPREQLHIASTKSTHILLEADSDNQNENDHPQILFSQDGGKVTGMMGYSDGDNYLTFAQDGIYRMLFKTDGKTRLQITGDGQIMVGDAETPNGYRMSVDGKMICEELRVQNTGNWPDYVFHRDYDLPELKSVKQHIELHSHLPGIPSAEEVEDNGISVGEMQKMLLKKIEELTLHTIRQQEEIDRLKNRIK